MILLRTFIQADQKKSGPSVQYTTSGCFEPPRDPPKRPLGVWSRKNVLANESSHGRGCTFLLKRFWALELLNKVRNYRLVWQFTVIFVWERPRRNDGRVARTNSFEFTFRGKYWIPNVRSSEQFAALLPWDDTNGGYERCQMVSGSRRSGGMFHDELAQRQGGEQLATPRNWRHQERVVSCVA